MDEEATLTEIQSIRQKMVEAYHIQRQYKTILDVISGERIGYESQLTDLEKSTADSKLEASKLKVRSIVSFSSFFLQTSSFPIASAQRDDHTFTRT
jgi:hypothetical protein